MPYVSRELFIAVCVIAARLRARQRHQHYTLPVPLLRNEICYAAERANDICRDGVARDVDNTPNVLLILFHFYDARFACQRCAMFRYAARPTQMNDDDDV